MYPKVVDKIKTAVIQSSGEQMISRRGFLGSAGAAFAATAPTKLEAKADTLILLWMAGGMAQTETFDPKTHTPFEAGLESNRVLSTFRPIDTVVDNIKFSEGLENIARVMDRGRANPQLSGWRSGLHPAQPASISLAHRLCAAAIGGRAALGRLDSQSARAAPSRHAGVCRRWTEP